MFQFVTQHQFWSAVVLSWIFSAAVSAMPDPGANPAYTWLYRFLHTIAGNLNNAFSGKIPGLKTLAFLLILPFVLLTPACAMHYQIHPGALNTIDSAAYDTLLIAETVIDRARLDYTSGRLPATAKAALDALVGSYNIARTSWLSYRAAVSTNVASGQYLAELTRDLTDLETAIGDLERTK